MKIFDGKYYFKQKSDKFINHYQILDKFIYLSAQQNEGDKELYGWELRTMNAPMFNFEIKVELDERPKDVSQIKPIVKAMSDVMVDLKKVELRICSDIDTEYAEKLGFTKSPDTSSMYQKTVGDVFVYAYEHYKGHLSSPVFTDRSFLPDVEISPKCWLNLENYEENEAFIAKAVQKIKGVRDEVFVRF